MIQLPIFFLLPATYIWLSWQWLHIVTHWWCSRSVTLDAFDIQRSIDRGLWCDMDHSYQGRKIKTSTNTMRGNKIPFPSSTDRGAWQKYYGWHFSETQTSCVRCQKGYSPRRPLSLTSIVLLKWRQYTMMLLVTSCPLIKLWLPSDRLTQLFRCLWPAAVPLTPTELIRRSINDFLMNSKWTPSYESD